MKIEATKTYTVKEAAAHLGIHPYNVGRRLARKYKIPVSASGLILGSDILEFARSRRVPPGPGVSVGEQSSPNPKLGMVYTTTAARQTCPEECQFRGSGGCYAEGDQGRRHWDRLTRQAKGKTPVELARAEAALIDSLLGTRDLRLHIAGDCSDPVGVKLIAEACRRFVGRSRVPVKRRAGRGNYPPDWPRRVARVWTYTHAWRTVPRHKWGSVSVLASVETLEGVFRAQLEGYATAIVVPEFKSDKAYVLTDGNLCARVIPCPAQTHADITCVDCRLCWDDKKLLSRGLTIGFAVHGTPAKRAAETLNRIALETV